MKLSISHPWLQQWFLVFLSYWVKEVKATQSCPTLCDPMDYTVHGSLQARILEWEAFPFSMGSSQPRDWTQVSCIGQILYQLSHQESPSYWVSTFIPFVCRAQLYVYSFPEIVLLISWKFIATIGFLFICPTDSFSFVRAFIRVCSQFFPARSAHFLFFLILNSLDKNHMNDMFVFFDLQMNYYFIRSIRNSPNFEFSNVMLL